jgi:hypothetical protein
MEAVVVVVVQSQRASEGRLFIAEMGVWGVSLVARVPRGTTTSSCDPTLIMVIPITTIRRCLATVKRMMEMILLDWIDGKTTACWLYRELGA